MIQLEIFLVIQLKEIKLFGNIIFIRKCIKYTQRNQYFYFKNNLIISDNLGYVYSLNKKPEK